jgi:hypothetical protein
LYLFFPAGKRLSFWDRSEWGKSDRKDSNDSNDNKDIRDSGDMFS